MKYFNNTSNNPPNDIRKFQQTTYFVDPQGRVMTEEQLPTIERFNEQTIYVEKSSAAYSNAQIKKAGKYAGMVQAIINRKEAGIDETPSLPADVPIKVLREKYARLHAGSEHQTKRLQEFDDTFAMS